MITAQAWQCLAPGQPPQFALRSRELGAPGPMQVLVQLEASAVNPIDAKRATGYGRRLLALKGAARFPLVLGNDLVGRVLAVGPGASFKPGDRVWGLLPTGRWGGTHASHVIADAALLRPAPSTRSAAALAVLPYTFTTLWLALRSVGLGPHNAAGKRVLVHGASGGLGQMAIQLLGQWGAQVTAVCSTSHVQACINLGAAAVWDRTRQPLSALPAHHDASFNFAHWPDEAALISRLRPGALGHATTVHPLLGSFDEHGWWRGGWQAWRAWSAMRQQCVAAGGPGTRYAWTIFQPDGAALDALVAWLHERPGQPLPIGVQVPLSQADQAFAHVAAQGPGRAVITFG
ncbi:MAG: hypothetical protein RJA34_1543 [Pseudomonadota bacterium]|jgi:NADPH:quinone reductase-like Zn-dependent oxidoreductase